MNNVESGCSVAHSGIGSIKERTGKNLTSAPNPAIVVWLARSVLEGWCNVESFRAREKESSPKRTTLKNINVLAFSKTVLNMMLL